MKSLNERLAVEVCGWTWDDEKNLWRDADGYGTLDGLDDEEEGVYLQDHWNPTTDLNQLRMCYEALSAGQQYKLRCDLVDQGMGPMLIFHNPELVAQAILKAKEVI